MKIILEFDDKDEAETAMKGGEYFSALCEIKMLVKSARKHGTYTKEELIQQVLELVEVI